jgi:hypothetical protein
MPHMRAARVAAYLPSAKLAVRFRHQWPGKKIILTKPIDEINAMKSMILRQMLLSMVFSFSEWVGCATG